MKATRWMFVALTWLTLVHVALAQNLGNLEATPDFINAGQTTTGKVVLSSITTTPKRSFHNLRSATKPSPFQVLAKARRRKGEAQSQVVKRPLRASRRGLVCRAP